MRQLGGKIDIGVALFQGIEILREGFPVPRHAVGHDHFGDVLHALHQLDRHLLIAGMDRGETDAAIAHDHGRHAMVGRRRQAVFPGHLTVIVGMDVDEAGRDDHAARVDFLQAGPVDLADRGNTIAADGDVAGEGYSA